jgi:hypothetical protein
MRFGGEHLTFFHLRDKSNLGRAWRGNTPGLIVAHAAALAYAHGGREQVDSHALTEDA